MPRKSAKSRLIEEILSDSLVRTVMAYDTDEEDEVFGETINDLLAVLHCRYGRDFVHGSVVKSRTWCHEVLPNMDLDRFRQMVRVSWLQFQIILDKV